MTVMSRVVIVGSSDLAAELGRTILWRSDIQRVLARDAEAGLREARARLPNLILIDDDRPEATLSLIRDVKSDPATRRASVAVLCRGPGSASEESLRRAGANLVLRPPVDPLLWDDRLEELLNEPRRREARISVRFQVWSRAPSEQASEGVGVNISVRGMLLETAEPLAVGSTLEMTFKLPGDPAQMRVVGQVVRAAGSSPEGRPRAGIDFIILRGDSRERINAFVESEVRR
jgi:hypothetical protein